MSHLTRILALGSTLPKVSISKSLQIISRRNVRSSGGAGPPPSQTAHDETPTTTDESSPSSTFSKYRKVLSEDEAKDIRNRLMQFFDNPKNWDKESIKVGREWKKDELRLKSNQDLHKLWFVLLKERNMLLTMLDQYIENNEVMPNEERLDKVDISMENLEEVVRERNRAFWELEIGESGERERHIIQSDLGMDEECFQKEHLVPWSNNKEFRRKTKFTAFFDEEDESGTLDFYRKLRERKYFEIRREKMEQLRDGARIIARHPQTTDEGLREKFDLVTPNEIRRYKSALGNHDNSHLDM